jgi:glycosyltransferase involved in cell wall biosynthesis
MAQDPLHLLCIEPRFPGRLGATADWLVRHRGYRCRFYCTTAESQEHWPASVGHGLDIIPYKVGGVAREPSVTWTRQLERGLCYAFGCWEKLEADRPRPIDLVLGRSAGLGSTLFVPVFRPRLPIVNLFDYFYHAHVHDLAEDAGADIPPTYFHWRRAANGPELLDLENGVTPWTLTRWQRDLFPVEYHQDFIVLHDGVSRSRFEFARARNAKQPRSVAGRLVTADAKVITFVARYLDRLRGFDRFMDWANRLALARSNVIFVVVGGSPVLRGLDVQFYNKDYRAHVLAQTPPHDPDRFWFLGSVAPQVVTEVLAASDLHLYPSRPYIVSRSLLEALGSGCVVLAADTQPVREFLTHGQTGLLVDPKDPEACVRQALAVLDDLPAYSPVGQAAAELVRENYSQDVTLPKLAELFDRLVDGKR